MEFCQFTPVHFYSARLEEGIESAISTESAIYCLISNGKHSHPTGFSSLTNIHKLNQSAEIGIFSSLASPSILESRLIIKALTSVIQFGFKNLCLNKLKAEILMTNLPGLALVERLAFSEEGHCRAKIFRDGRSQDTRLFALFKQDWSRMVSQDSLWRYISC